MLKATIIGVLFALMLAFAPVAEACACGGDPAEMVTQWNKMSDEMRYYKGYYGYLPTPPPGYTYAEDYSMVPSWQ